MVLLTMTPSIVEALAQRSNNVPEAQHRQDGGSGLEEPALEEPALEEPALGKPISHGQIIELWEDLREHKLAEYSLESLLKGAQVYIAPPPPKPQPTAEYTRLMARLRHEAEERSYQRMATHHNPASAQQYPTSSLAYSFANIHRPSTAADEGDNTEENDEAHRQVMLVLNFLLTILGCAGTLWVLARWWSTPARLFLTLGGSVVVGVAEVGVYQAYLWHLGEAKKKMGRVVEKKEIVETWVVGREEAKTDGDVETMTDTKSNEQDGHEDAVRRRKGRKTEET